MAGDIFCKINYPKYCEITCLAKLFVFVKLGKTVSFGSGQTVLPSTFSVGTLKFS